MELSERIKMIVEYSGLSIPKFAEFVGFKTPQAVRELIKGNTKTLSFQAQEKIISSYPEINVEWLTKGKGEMLSAAAPPQQAVGTRPRLPVNGTAGQNEIMDGVWSRRQIPRHQPCHNAVLWGCRNINDGVIHYHGVTLDFCLDWLAGAVAHPQSQDDAQSDGRCMGDDVSLAHIVILFYHYKTQ